MRVLRYIAIFFLLLLWVPLLQTLTRVLPEERLHGAVAEIKQPAFTLNKWSNNMFQDEMAAWLDSKTGLRAMLIRLRNQWLKILFDESGEKDFFIGKNGNVFSRNNIRSVTGDDFTGKDNFEQRMAKLKVISDSLAKRGIPLLVLIAPGKANLYPQDIPAQFIPAEKTQTNYFWLSKSLRESGLVFMDMHNWFSKIIDTSEHVLMTKLGIHWSVYAQALVLDSLCKKLHALKPMPHRSPVITKIIKSDKPLLGDNDTEPVLNLLSKPSYENYSYPILKYTGRKRDRVKLVCVGDSYFMNFVSTQTANELFIFNYWYYHNTAYSNSKPVYSSVKNLPNYWETLYGCDYVVLVHSEVTWREPGFDFIDKVFTRLTEGK